MKVHLEADTAACELVVLYVQCFKLRTELILSSFECFESVQRQIYFILSATWMERSFLKICC